MLKRLAATGGGSHIGRLGVLGNVSSASQFCPTFAPRSILWVDLS
jgi:hypothetical protein